MKNILFLSFIISSLISGTYFFIDKYKKNKKFLNNNPWKDDVFTILFESYTMGCLVGFVSTIIVGIILVIVNSL